MFANILSAFRNVASSRSKGTSSRRLSSQPMLEGLENRLTPSATALPSMNSIATAVLGDCIAFEVAAKQTVVAANNVIGSIATTTTAQKLQVAQVESTLTTISKDANGGPIETVWNDFNKFTNSLNQSEQTALEKNATFMNAGHNLVVDLTEIVELLQLAKLVSAVEQQLPAPGVSLQAALNEEALSSNMVNNQIVSNINAVSMVGNMDSSIDDPINFESW